MNQNPVRRRGHQPRNQNPGQPENANARRRRRTPANNFTTLHYILLILVIFFTTVIIVGFYKKDPYDLRIGSYEQIKSAENITTAAGILKKCVQIFEGLGRLENATNTYKSDGLMATFLKSKYQTAISTLSSLTALVKKYEDMKRGVKPEQFIKTSLKQLDGVMEYLVDELEGDDFAAVLRRDGDIARELWISVKEAFKTFDFIQVATSDSLLLKEQIYLVPVAAIDKGDEDFKIIKEEILRKHDLSTALEAVKGLVSILTERDKWVEELLKIDLKYGIRENEGDTSKLDISETDVYWMQTIHDKLDEWEEAKEKYLKEHDLAIQSLLAHHQVIWEKIQHLRAETQIQAEMTNKIVQMRREIHDNVDELRRRLEKL